ncbi:MAG: hypothetical protein JEZ00_08500 [Anaerolineaceae bacterium]|nr:hypothetical protein [Anaerolineaceae bacterium]
MNAEFLWTLLGLLLTLIVLSYLFGDHVFFRLVSYMFVGCAAGYVAVIVIYQVILPRLAWPLLSGTSGERILALGGLVLSILLFSRLVPGLSRAGNISLAYLVGVSSAVIISGAIYGTIIPQVNAVTTTIDSGLHGTTVLYRILEGITFLIGSVSSLAFFHYGTRAKSLDKKRLPIIEFFARIGSGFISITFGAVFAGVYAAALSALMDRLVFILNFFQKILPGVFS